MLKTDKLIESKLFEIEKLIYPNYDQSWDFMIGTIDFYTCNVYTSSKEDKKNHEALDNLKKLFDKYKILYKVTEYPKNTYISFNTVEICKRKFESL